MGSSCLLANNLVDQEYWAQQFAVDLNQRKCKNDSDCPRQNGYTVKCHKEWYLLWTKGDCKYLMSSNNPQFTTDLRCKKDNECQQKGYEKCKKHWYRSHGKCRGLKCTNDTVCHQRGYKKCDKHFY